jgi:hypothetical protein
MTIAFDFDPTNDLNQIQQIAERIDATIDSDPFLREKIDKEKLVKFFTKDRRIRYTLRSSVSPLSKKIVINLSLLNKPDTPMNVFSESRILTQVYRIPGEEKVISIRPLINQKLKGWYDNLNDELFPLYFPYESALINMGVNKGIMLNHPHLIEEIYGLYSHIAQTSLLDLMIKNPQDYLLHYTQGIPCIWPVFSLINTKEKGEELKTRLTDAYGLSHPLVAEKIIEHGNLIAENDPFNECYYPSLSGDVNYLTLLDRFLQDSIEIRRLCPHMSQVTYNPEYEHAKSYFLDSLKGQGYVH